MPSVEVVEYSTLPSDPFRVNSLAGALYENDETTASDTVPAETPESDEPVASNTVPLTPPPPPTSSHALTPASVLASWGSGRKCHLTCAKSTLRGIAMAGILQPLVLLVEPCLNTLLLFLFTARP